MLFILIYKFCVIKTTTNFEKSFSCSKIIHFLFLNNSTFSVYFLNCFLTAGTVWVRSISKTIFFFISFPNVPPHTKLSPTLGQKGIFAATIGKFVLARKNCELWARGVGTRYYIFFASIYNQPAVQSKSRRFLLYSPPCRSVGPHYRATLVFQCIFFVDFE